MDTQTIIFKGSRVNCVVCGSSDYQMNFEKVHNVA